MAESVSYAITQPPEELAKMDKWNVNTHTKSGITGANCNQRSCISLCRERTVEINQKYVHKASSPLCGNTIHQDRKFIVRYMPELEEYLHYRNIDVSTIKELARRWYPKVVEGFKKHNKHEALADIHESIEELKYYRQHIMLENMFHILQMSLSSYSKIKYQTLIQRN